MIRKLKKVRPVLKYVITLSLVFLTLESFAQEDEEEEKIEKKKRSVIIGNPSPDAEMKSIINFQESKAKISDFKDRLLILDFWATWCSPCVAGLAKVDSLQKRFNNKLQIMPIATQNKKTVRDFLIARQNMLHTLPPSVTDDVDLEKLFKHSVVPHYVWINKGIIVGITGGEELNESNIEKIISGQIVKFPQKVDFRRNVDMSKPLFVVGNPIKYGDSIKVENIDTNNILYHSVFTRYLEGLHGSAQFDPSRFAAINMPLVSLLKLTIGRGKVMFYTNRVKIQIKDSAKYDMITGDSVEKLHNGSAYINWLKDHGYCYEIQLPKSVNEDTKWKIIAEDMKRCVFDIYNIEAKIEKIKTKCLVLSRIKEEDRLSSKGGPVEFTHNAFSLHMQNKPFWVFYAELEGYYLQNSTLPLVDETGLKENVDMDINCKMSDVNSLNKELEKYGLRFIENDRDLEFLVIKDKK